MRRICQITLVTLIVALLTIGAASPAAAHTGFESSNPADGATVDAGLDTLTISFTNEATETGEGFVVLDPDLGLRSPTTVTNPDVGKFVLGFDQPINSGAVGVRWTVKAPDAHPIDGAFQFTVAAPATTASTSAPEPAGTAPDVAAAPSEAETPSLDEFLATSQTTQSGRTIANAGRFLAMGAMMVALGFIVFALTVMRGTQAELRLLVFWIRRAGIVVVVGTLLDGIGQVVFETGEGLSAAYSPSAHLDVLTSSLGLALFLRLAGGVIVTAGARISMVHAHEARDVVRTVSAAVPVGAGSTRVADHPDDYWDERAVAWDLDRHGLVAAGGFALLLVSHAFDGHTVTEGNRIVTGAASGLHVLAAAVWVGGVAALALIIGHRARLGEPTHSLVMVTRFSVVATLALVAVAGLGFYLAFVIVDAPSDLWQTDWGRILLAKTFVVAVAAGLGARNHHVLVPALEAAEEDDATVTRLRHTLRIEVLTLAAVVVVTAFLVRAASTL